MRIFCLTLGLLTGVPAQSSCLPGAETEAAKVEYVHDGDTVKLANGRKLRLIGVDTPEIGNDRQPPEPLAVEARDFVRKLLRQHNNRVQLLYDAELTDAYHRRLAHVFLPDDLSLSELLLQKGLATTLIIPPNTRYSNCYARAEKIARNRGKGLWSLSRYRAISVGQLVPEATGFRIVRGRILRVSRQARGDYIYVGELESDRVLRVKIAKEDRAFFDEAFLKTLTGKPIEIRGRIYHKNGRFFARVRHTTALQILTP